MRVTVSGLLTGLVLATVALPSEAQPGAGALQWRFVTGGEIRGAPAIGHDGILYLASADRFLYALYPDGSIKWKLRLDGRLHHSPAIGHDAAILVASDAGTLYSVRPNGAIRWHHDAGERSCGGPAVDPRGRIILASCSGELQVYSNTGHLTWSLRLSAEVQSRPAVARDGTIYIATSDRRLHAIDGNGHKRWERRLSGQPDTPAVGSDGTIYIGGAGVTAVSAAGAVAWRYTVPAPTGAPVIGPDGVLLACAANGRLYAIAPDGHKLWDTWIGVGLEEPAAVAADGTAFVPAGSYIVAVGADGRPMWRYPTREAATAVVVGTDGTVYAGAADWVMYALDGAAGALLPGPWSMQHGQANHSSRVSETGHGPNLVYVLLDAQVRGTSGDQKHAALDHIAKLLTGDMVASIGIGAVESLLEYAAREGVSLRKVESSRPVNDHPDVRMRASELLGDVATDRALGVLIDVLRYDRRTEVQRSALLAIGNVGSDIHGDAVRAVATAIMPVGERATDYATISLGVEALRSIARLSGGLAHADGYRALAVVSVEQSLPRRLREQARSALHEAVEARTGTAVVEPGPTATHGAQRITTTEG